MENLNNTKANYSPSRILQASIFAAATIIAIYGGTLLGNYGAQTFNSNIADTELTSDTILTIDLAENTLDLFNDL